MAAAARDFVSDYRGPLLALACALAGYQLGRSIAADIGLFATVVFGFLLAAFAIGGFRLGRGRTVTTPVPAAPSPTPAESPDKDALIAQLQAELAEEHEVVAVLTSQLHPGQSGS